MKVAILAIGSEVLCGKTINTNSSFIAKEIEQIGGKVVHQQVVADELDEIVSGLKIAYSYADIVITIGGLGPTVDDLSRDGVAQYFNVPLVYDEAIYQGICEYFDRMNKPIPPNNARQAYKFEGAIILPNNNGTAPGLCFEKGNQCVFLLPGPPHELQAMFIESVQPYFLDKMDAKKISKSYRLCGIGESYAEEKIMHLYEKYPHLNIAPYCAIGQVDYIISTTEEYESELQMFDTDFKAILSDHIIGTQQTDICTEIIMTLKNKNLTIATAESCTGGLLSSSLVNVSGVSNVFLEGIVTYSYESKMNRLNIDRDRLMKHGAVSEEIAHDMALNLRQLTDADITVGITGIAGPNGGTELKPVGLVYIGINVRGKIFVNSYIFNGNREKIRQHSVAQTLYLLHQSIKAL